ncbi:MAG: universal stress protein [Thermoproteota archaeon]|nr:universal stress protein [Thermoproteota archaeon]
MNLQNILVPYDGTDDSENAILEGAKLALFFKSKIIILFVIEEKYFSNPYSDLKPDSSFEQKKEELINMIESNISEIIKRKLQELREKGLDAKYVMETGQPTEIILNLAKNKKADMIVMGRKGLRRLGRIKAIGSVSRSIAENADIPIMMVSDSLKNTYERVLVPYDIQNPNSSNNALDIALSFKDNNNGCTITVLHIVPEPPIPHTISKILSTSIIKGKKKSLEDHFKDRYPEAKERANKIIKEMINVRYKEEKKISIKISYGAIAERVIEFAEQENIDLLVMGTNPLKGISKIASLGSISRQVAESVSCPIILVK